VKEYLSPYEKDSVAKGFSGSMRTQHERLHCILIKLIYSVKWTFFLYTDIWVLKFTSKIFIFKLQLPMSSCLQMFKILNFFFSKNSCDVCSCVKKCVSSGSKLLKYLATELNPIVYLCVKQSVNILERIHGLFHHFKWFVW
jgi:hypothetical protein